MNNQNLDDEMMKVIGDENGNEDHHQYNRSSQLIGTSLISTTASIPLLGSSTSDSMISTRMTRYKSTLIDCLGDAGSYSLCGLCTLLFHKYFPESHHR